jgi:tetratricopeptide (TPR) repeat protein
MIMKRFKAEAACIPFILCIIGCEPSYEQLHAEGVREWNAGNIIAARGLFKAAIEKQPESPDTLYYTAMVYEATAKENFEKRNVPGALRELDHSLAYYDRAIQAYPGYTAALRGKNRAYELRGDYKQALGVAQWASVYAGPNAEKHRFLSDELAERGDYDNALLRLRQGVKMEPEDVNARIALAQFYLRNRQTAEAAAELEIAYRLDPENRRVTDALASIGYEPMTATRSISEDPPANASGSEELP